MLREWRMSNAFRREFDDLRGHVTLPHVVGLGYLRAVGSWGFFCPLLIPVAGYGAWKLRRAPEGWFLLAWGAAFFLFMCGLQVVSRRYVLPALPPLAVLAAVGMAALMEAAPADRRGSCVARRVSCVVLVLAMGAGTYANLAPLAAKKRCELEAVRWIEANTPAGSRVAAVELGLALRRYGTREVVMLHESDPAAWRMPPGDAPGLYVVWDEAFIERHMAKRPRPGARAPDLGPHARRLRESARLTPLARVCRWEILRVNAATGDGR
jgi:hypothetical protein